MCWGAGSAASAAEAQETVCETLHNQSLEELSRVQNSIQSPHTPEPHELLHETDTPTVPVFGREVIEAEQPDVGARDPEESHTHPSMPSFEHDETVPTLTGPTEMPTLTGLTEVTELPSDLPTESEFPEVPTESDLTEVPTELPTELPELDDGATEASEAPPSLEDGDSWDFSAYQAQKDSRHKAVQNHPHFN